MPTPTNPREIVIACVRWELRTDTIPGVRESCAACGHDVALASSTAKDLEAFKAQGDKARLLCLACALSWARSAGAQLAEGHGAGPNTLEAVREELGKPKDWLPKLKPGDLEKLA